MTHKQLSQRIIAGILKKPDMPYSTLEAHANKLGIAPGIFQTAMSLVHKSSEVYGRIKGGEIVYAPKVKKSKEPGSHLRWLRNNYPRMDSSNDGSGIDVDYSYLFLSPTELQDFKAELKGMKFIKKKQYEHTR